MWRPCLGMLVLAACAGSDAIAPYSIEPYVDSSKADGHPARLEYLDRARVHIDEPSDLVMGFDGLYAVSDRHSKIYWLDPDGDSGTYLDIDGTDLEALGYDPARGEFLIGDEAKAKIWTIDDDGDRHDAIDLDSADDGNSGIEGLVVGEGGHLFVVKEKDPARIYELDADGSVLANDKIHFADDLSAITYNPLDHHLYVTSDEDQALFRLDAAWQPDRAWKLPMAHPEGLAFDGDLLYLVSDSEERIYTFSLVD